MTQKLIANKKGWLEEHNVERRIGMRSRKIVMEKEEEEEEERKSIRKKYGITCYWRVLE